jgi:recombination protein RecA
MSKEKVVKKEEPQKKNSKAIDAAIAALAKRFGEPVVMRMSDANTGIDTFSTGRADLDIALGGGYAVGKIIEIFAQSGAGKTGLALEAIREIQKAGGLAAIIDAEHALNTEYCTSIGVNVDDLLISQPSYGEQAFETIRALINTAEVDLIVVDSVSALVPKAELEGESGEVKMALQARMMSQGMKLIAGPASTVGCTIIFINQLRKTIAMYGPAETTSGGMALKFYASQRLEVKNKGQIKEGEDVIGFKQQITSVKNKVAPPFKVIENNITYGIGVDDFPGLIESLVFEEILEKAGAWFKYKGSNIAQGIKKLRVVLDDNPELYEELRSTLKNK